MFSDEFWKRRSGSEMRSDQPSANAVSKHSSLRIKSVLLVDNGNRRRLTTKWFLTSFGFAVEVARNAEEALALFDARVHDAVVACNALPGMSGNELAHIIKLRSCTTPVILFTDGPLRKRSCADSVLEEPVHPLAVKEAVDHALTARSKFN